MIHFCKKDVEQNDPRDGMVGYRIEIFRLMSDSFGSRGLSPIRCPSANTFVLLGHFNPSRTAST